MWRNLKFFHMTNVCVVFIVFCHIFAAFLGKICFFLRITLFCKKIYFVSLYSLLYEEKSIEPKIAPSEKKCEGCGGGEGGSANCAGRGGSDGEDGKDGDKNVGSYGSGIQIKQLSTKHFHV